MYTKTIVVLATFCVISQSVPYGGYGNYHHFNIYDVINKLDHFDDKYAIAKSWGPNLPTSAPVAKSNYQSLDSQTPDQQSLDHQSPDEQSFNQQLSNDRIRRDTEWEDYSNSLSEPDDLYSPVLTNNANFDYDHSNEENNNPVLSSIIDVVPETDVDDNF